MRGMPAYLRNPWFQIEGPVCTCVPNSPMPCMVCREAMRARSVIGVDLAKGEMLTVYGSDEIVRVTGTVTKRLDPPKPLRTFTNPSGSVWTEIRPEVWMVDKMPSVEWRTYRVLDLGITVRRDDSSDLAIIWTDIPRSKVKVEKKGSKLDPIDVEVYLEDLDVKNRRR